MADGNDVPFQRPEGTAPSADAPLDERERWSREFVEFYIALTGGETELEPLGHRWRAEYFMCLPDPRAYELLVAQEIADAIAGRS